MRSRGNGKDREIPAFVWRYAYRIAHHYHPKVGRFLGVTVDDLAQTALEAYVRDCWGAGRTYCWLRMRGHVLDFIDRQFTLRGVRESGSTVGMDEPQTAEILESDFLADYRPEEEDEFEVFVDEGLPLEDLLTRKAVLDFIAREFGASVAEAILTQGTQAGLAEAWCGVRDSARGHYYLFQKIVPALHARFPDLFAEGDEKDGGEG